jgi:hypothetical protein
MSVATKASARGQKPRGGSLSSDGTDFGFEDGTKLGSQAFVASSLFCLVKVRPKFRAQDRSERSPRLTLNINIKWICSTFRCVLKHFNDSDTRDTALHSLSSFKKEHHTALGKFNSALQSFLRGGWRKQSMALHRRKKVR